MALRNIKQAGMLDAEVALVLKTLPITGVFKNQMGLILVAAFMLMIRYIKPVGVKAGSLAQFTSVNLYRVILCNIRH